MQSKVDPHPVGDFNHIAFEEVKEFFLRLDALTEFLQSVVAYLPNILVAALILLAGLLIAEFLARIVMAGVKATNMHRPALVGNATRWVVWIFSILSALNQLGIGTFVVSYVLIGLVFGLSLALGLSFGLGGKDVAAQIVGKIRRDFSDHQGDHHQNGGMNGSMGSMR